MVPRVATRAATRQTQLVAQTRSAYFMPEPGSEGIWRRTLGEVHMLLRWLSFALMWFMFYGMERRYGTEDQFIACPHDLWEDDGTELEGEEAVAYHRIWKERVMPYMDELQAKIDSA